MAGTFGTLRADSFFTPGEVLDEATQLNNAIRALAQIQFNSLDSQGQDQLSAWNAFIASWDDFWAQCNGNGSLQWLTDQFGWFFRAKDSTRDELLNFERQYADLKTQIGTFSGAASLPDPAPEASRTPDNLKSAIDNAGADASDAAKQAGQAARNLVAELWPVLALAGIGVGLYVFRGPIVRVLKGVAR